MTFMFFVVLLFFFPSRSIGGYGTFQDVITLASKMSAISQCYHSKPIKLKLSASSLTSFFFFYVHFRYYQAIQSQSPWCRSWKDSSWDACSYQRNGLQSGCDWTQHLVRDSRWFECHEVMTCGCFVCFLSWRLQFLWSATLSLLFLFTVCVLKDASLCFPATSPVRRDIWLIRWEVMR